MVGLDNMASHVDVESLIRFSDIEGMRKDLLQWWNIAKREFPWRETRDPYSITIAEILLHRTIIFLSPLLHLSH